MFDGMLSGLGALSQPCLNLDLHPLQINMASPLQGHDEFIHQIAIKLSRAINTVNPNDLLARNVVEIAKTQSMDGFMTGVQKPRHHRDFISISTSSGHGFWQVQEFFSSRIIYRDLVACQGGNDRYLVATDTRHYGS
jgi:hypothetical protein